MTSDANYSAMVKPEPYAVANLCRFCLDANGQTHRIAEWSGSELARLYQEVTGTDLSDMGLIASEWYCDECLGRLRYLADSLRMFKKAELFWANLMGKTCAAQESKNVIFVNEDEIENCFLKAAIVDNAKTVENKQNIDGESSNFVLSEENIYVYPDIIINDLEAYKCFECQETFNCRSSLEEHKKVSKHLKQFVCEDCGQSYARRLNLATHREKHFHSLFDIFECDHCEKKFGTKARLKNHLHGVHLGQPAQCPKCLKNYRNVAVMQAHLRQHNERKHECIICQRRFINLSALTKHIRVVHTDDHPYVCAQCGTMFRTKRSLEVHNSRPCSLIPWNGRRQSMRFPNAKPRIAPLLTCRCCDKKYSEEKTLRSHYRDYHPQANYEEVACLICLICCLQFDDIASLQEHAARHAKLECSVCKNLFVNEQSLRSHMLNHSKRERPFTCDLCQATFVRKFHLGKHMLSRHVLVRPIACDLCDTRFMDKCEQRDHKRRVHDKIKPHKCKMCDMTFATAMQLRIHLARHIGAHKYACGFCHEKFYNATNLNIHVSRFHSNL